MNIFDFIIIIIFAGLFFRGYKLGLIRQLVHLLGFIVALFVAYKFSNILSPYLQKFIPAPTFDNPTINMFSQTFDLQGMFYNALAFILLFIGTKLFLNIAGAILHQVASLPVLSTVNNLSGAFIGLFQALILTLILLNLILVMPFSNLQNNVYESVISGYLLNLTPVVTEALYNLWSGPIEI